jgi:hypothetical protein
MPEKPSAGVVTNHYPPQIWAVDASGKYIQLWPVQVNQCSQFLGHPAVYHPLNTQHHYGAHSFAQAGTGNLWPTTMHNMIPLFAPHSSNQAMDQVIPTQVAPSLPEPRLRTFSDPAMQGSSGSLQYIPYYDPHGE